MESLSAAARSPVVGVYAPEILGKARKNPWKILQKNPVLPSMILGKLQDLTAFSIQLFAKLLFSEQLHIICK